MIVIKKGNSYNELSEKTSGQGVSYIVKGGYAYLVQNQVNMLQQENF